MADIEDKKQKLKAFSSTQMTAAEPVTRENQVGVNVDRKRCWAVNVWQYHAILQSSYGVLATRGRGTDEDLVFNEFPKEKLLGKNFFRSTIFDEKEIAYDFQILKVSGHVRWRHKKSKGSDAKLTLLRWSDGEGDCNLPKLQLAKYVAEPDEEGFTKTQFEFVPDDAKATSSYRFWNPGYKGAFGANECASPLRVRD